MLTTIDQKTAFIEYLWSEYSNELDSELKSKCLELSAIYDDFCIFGISAGNQCAVYLIPFNHSSLALLREEAGAFWGVSYSSGKSFELRAPENQKIDKYILDATELPFFKFRSSDLTPFSELNKKLDIYLRVKLQRKKSLFSHEITLDELLSRFNDALAVEDIKSAEAFLQHIENRPEISVTNKIFLTIKYFYLIKNWQGIVNHKHILDLKDIRRPRLITEYILMAIFITQIRPVISDPETALRVYNEKVGPLFSSMILFSDDYRAIEIYLLLALALLGKSNPEKYEIEFIRKKLSEVSDLDIPVSQYLKLLDGIGTPYEKTPDLNEELQILDDSEKYYDMIHLLDSNKNDLTVGHLKYIQGIQSDKLDVSLARKVSNLFSSLDARLRDEALKTDKLKRMLEKVDTISKKDITIDSWLKMVVNNQEESEIRTTLGDLKSSLDDQEITSETIELLGKIFAIPNNPWTEEIKSLLPGILTGFERLNPELMTRDWKLELLRFICESPRLQNRDRLLVQDILGLLLDEALTSDEYDTVIIYIDLVWDKLQSPSSILWPLEVLDEIYNKPIRNQNELDKFTLKYTEYLCNNRNSLDGSDISQIESFFADKERYNLQLIGLLRDTRIIEKRNLSVGAICSFLDKVKIGIYSLEETAAKRAKYYFTILNEQSDIVLNHDKSCTEALKTLSARSDIFVFAARAAKHAAFHCVRHRDLVYPAGKGASSIINAIVEYMKKNNSLIAAT